MEKKYKIDGKYLKQLMDGSPGSGMASDQIIVEGKGIYYMYREEPEQSHDSGWRFFSGQETQEYVDNPENFAYYKLNTIVNYEPLILDYLEAEIGTAFERKIGEHEFFRIEEDNVGNEDDQKE